MVNVTNSSVARNTGSGSTAPTGVTRQAVTAIANTVTVGAAGAVVAATEVGKAAVGALDWTKVKSETEAGNAARANQALASATAPTPPPQPNQMAMMAWQALSGIGPMLAGLLKKGNNSGNGNSKPPNPQETTPNTPSQPNQTNDIKTPKKESEDQSAPKPAEEQKSSGQTKLLSPEDISS